ncbi:MAG TPA: HAMP domain-containing sensor histidine kinase [Candidatus Acidoferrum sp.]|nr:HAMP domain-containing sensor histidine kinase [Candidatus Acidoferrum sp.]
MPPPREDLDRILHDLRGPLNSMVMHVEVLKRALAEDPDALASVAAIQGELARLTRMLPAAFDVLALERGESARVSLRALVDRALVEHRLAKVQVLDGAWPEVDGDGDLLVLAIAHLVRNALAATSAAGREDPPPRIGVETGEPGRVTLVVRDWGTGFKKTNPTVLVRLAGVGLLTVERVARLHGGHLSFASPGDGAEVRLTLPA